MSDSWCTIESDPAVFTELIAKFGVKDVQVSEIYSLDQNVGESYGLIFLFKWKSETDSRQIIDQYDAQDLFFARQVIQNACATQAILSVLLNVSELNLGPELDEFKQFTAMFDSESKGLAISNSDMIRTAHNSFARPEPFQIEEKESPKAKGDAYHFIAYIPFQGCVYELDGLKSGPIRLGVVDGNDWLTIARPAVEERIARYSTSETHFALMSIGRSRQKVIEELISSHRERLESLQSEMSDDNAESTVVIMADVMSEIAKLENELVEIAEKSKAQSRENVRRKHNYIPFLSALVHALADKGKLVSISSSGNA